MTEPGAFLPAIHLVGRQKLFQTSALRAERRRSSAPAPSSVDRTTKLDGSGTAETLELLAVMARLAAPQKLSFESTNQPKLSPAASATVAVPDPVF